MKLKIVFKFILPLGLALSTLGVVPGVATPAHAQQVYWTPRDLLASFFPKSERVSFERFVIDAPSRERLKTRLGMVPAKPVYTFYVATTAGRVDGYALIDEEMGQHLPITFAVKLSPQAVVERQEIVTYREPRGEEVTDCRFRQQFVGKTAKDPLRLSIDVAAITGATISSAAMATGVRRSIALLEEFLSHKTQRTTASVRSTTSVRP
jgi:electron transport complex protein RnfG